MVIYRQIKKIILNVQLIWNNIEDFREYTYVLKRDSTFQSLAWDSRSTKR